jgi:monofunctional biosynthetic peptidoglycan transglycosylase
VVLVLFVLVAWLAWEAITWPNVRALATRPPASTTFIERHKASEREAGRLPRAEWRWVPSSAISIHLKRAAVVAEDAAFFRHHGFSTAEMREAALQALEERRIPRGASTITQQLAKNLWLSPSRSPLRKAREAILTWQLERTLSKRRILELYLNVAEFGPGVYGAEAGSRIYFDKPAAALSPDEAAQLAAGLPRPRTWHPGITSPGYRRYVETIRARMQRADLPERLLR